MMRPKSERVMIYQVHDTTKFLLSRLNKGSVCVLASAAEKPSLARIYVFGRATLTLSRDTTPGASACSSNLLKPIKTASAPLLGKSVVTTGETPFIVICTYSSRGNGVT